MLVDSGCENRWFIKSKEAYCVLTGQQKSSDSNEKSEEEQVASSNHIIIRECDDSDSEIELAETPETLEEGGQATVDDLKELNFGTKKEPCPICVSSLLT